MVEINNQREAFLEVCWRGRRELITGTSENQKSWLWRHCRRRAIYWYSDHPRKLVTLNPKLKSTGAGRYQLLSRWWDAYRQQLGLKDFSPKSQDAVALQQIKERGALPMIDRGDIRRAIDRCSNIWASLPGAGYGQFEHKGWQPDCKFKAGGTVREIDVWAESPRLSPLWLSASSSACHGLLIITVITPYLQSPARQKCQKVKLANAAITDMQMRQRDVATLDAKYTKELADAKAENDALRDDVAAGRRRLHIKAVYWSVREATTASGVDNAASPTGRHRWTDYFTLKRLITMQKQLEGTQKYINEQCR